MLILLYKTKKILTFSETLNLPKFYYLIIFQNQSILLKTRKSLLINYIQFINLLKMYFNKNLKQHSIIIYYVDSSIKLKSMTDFDSHSHKS